MSLFAVLVVLFILGVIVWGLKQATFVDEKIKGLMTNLIFGACIVIVVFFLIAWVSGNATWGFPVNGFRIK